MKTFPTAALPRIASLGAVLAVCFGLTACGGGGTGASNGKSSASGSGGSSGAALTAGSGSPCAPNLCVNFGYPTASATRVLTGSIAVTDTSTLTGYAPHYALVSGSLPPGMTLDALTGSISGTPTTDGLYSATIALTVAGFSGSLSTSVGIDVVEPQFSFSQGTTPIVPGASDSTKFAQFYLPGTALSGQALSLHGGDNNPETLAAGGGLGGRVVYSVTGSIPLPPGLSLDAGTGAITGTPTQAGVWITQVQAVVTTGTATDTFNGYAPIAVGPVIQETRGQAAAAPVQFAVHVDPAVSVDTSLGLSIGNPDTTLAYDASAQVVTITPAAISGAATPGTYLGASRLLFTTANGSAALAGYVEVVN